jgi:peptide/nickel transport system substrate-binding protein
MEHITLQLTQLSSTFKNLLLATLLCVIPAQALLAQQSPITSDTTKSEIVKPENQTLVIGLVGSLADSDLNPQINSNPLIKTISYENIFQGLTHVISSGSLEMLLAKQIAVAKNGNHAIITLRDDITWSDGSKVSSSDVITTFDHLTSGKNPDAHKFAHIKEYKAIDNNTIEVMLNRPDPDFIYNLSTAGATLIKQDGDNPPIGTGPYVLSTTSITAEQSEVYLTANPNYWGSKGTITTAVFQVYPRNDMAIGGLKAGTIDYLPNFQDPKPAQTFVDNKDINLQIGFSEEKVILAMNNTEPRLAQPLVRKTFAHAINKKTLSEKIMNRTAPIIGSHFSISHVAYVDLSSSYPNSVEISRKLIALSELENKNFTLTIPQINYLQRTAQSIKLNLASVGFNIEIETLPLDEYNTRVFENKDYQLALVNHPETNDIGLYATDNYMNYSNPYFSLVYNMEIREMNVTARNASLSILQRFLALDQPAVYLYQKPNINISKKELYGYRLHAPVNALVLSDLFWDR